MTNNIFVEDREERERSVDRLAKAGGTSSVAECRSNWGGSYDVPLLIEGPVCARCCTQGVIFVIGVLTT